MNIVIYHHNDTDGKVSAAIMAEYFKALFHYNDWGCVPKFIFHSVDYTVDFSTNEEFEKVDTAVDTHTVCFVDYSFSKPNNLTYMINLANKGVRIIWIDHHKTSLDIMDSIEPNQNIFSMVDTKYCAARLCFEYGMESLGLTLPESDEKYPRLVRLVDSWDTWKLNEPRTKDWHYGMSQYLRNSKLDTMLSSLYGVEYAYFNKEIDFVNDPNKDITKAENSAIGGMIRNGHIISSYVNGTNMAAVKNTSFEFTIFDNINNRQLKCLAVNRAGNSMMFENVISYYDIVVSFTLQRDQWVSSLYTSHNDIDCSYYAEILGNCKDIGGLGGGGHKSAAGFQSKGLPFYSTDSIIIRSSTYRNQIKCNYKVNYTL